MVISRFFLTGFLAIVFALCSRNALAFSMIEVQWLSVSMTSDRGDRVELESDGERLTRVDLTIDGKHMKLDCKKYREVGVPILSSITLLLDAAPGAVTTRHLLIPFTTWRDEQHDQLELMLTIRNGSIERSAVIAEGQLNDPVYEWNVEN